jgi:signal transduction histidine kinase
MRFHLGLRGKLMVVSLCSVIVAVGGVIFINAQLAQRAFTQWFAEEVTTLAKEFAADFGGAEALDDRDTLIQKIYQIQEARPEVQHISIFVRSTDNEWQLAATDADPPTARLGRQDVANLMRDRTRVDIQTRPDDRLWVATTPIRDETSITGALRIAISGQVAQEDWAKARRQILLILTSTVLVVGVALTIFMQHAVYRPIKGLVNAMQQAQTGSLAVAVVPRGHDELVQLTEHFNRMVQRIQQDSTEKEQLLFQIQRFNEALQARVREATQALAQRNVELQHVNEALFHSQRQLSQWERLAGMVYQSAAIAHEMGTPLHSIVGHLHLLLTDAQLPEESRRRLKIIESQIDRISETLHAMLASAKQPTPQLISLDLNALVREVLQLTSPGMARHHVDLHMRLQADLPLVLADPNQLQQVFLNLIANALDAMPTGGELTVETASADADAASTTQVLVRIRDTGSGIAPQHLHKLFTPFFTTKNAGQGTGIGLAVCRQIIHAHGGSIEVQSQPGVGSTFTLSLLTPQSKVEKP